MIAYAALAGLSGFVIGLLLGLAINFEKIED
jgi:hypothetical protein